MSNKVINVENLSKQYRLGKIGTGALSHDLNRWWHTMRGKEDPYLKIGETNDRTKSGNSSYVWSLKDINFDIEQGDAVGIIGRNGAGKSTLLKILSRVTAPTTGSVKIKGRVASLLEVGTGFHPELSGRENVYLNGAILGMRKHEIKKHFDEIVDFAGVERYIDTPVKRYSSGMYVRLAFAVAAYLESEILIVDEVLAVGDAEFQKKCLGKINDVSKGEGRTVLFVSHNIGSIYALTNTCIFMDQGRLIDSGPTSRIALLYQNANQQNDGNNLYFEKKQLSNDKPIEMLTAKIEIENNATVNIFVRYVVKRRIGSVVSVRINNAQGVTIITLRDTDRDQSIFTKEPGEYSVQFAVPVHMLSPSTFRVTFSFSDMKSERFDFFEDLLAFEIEESTEQTESTAVREGIMKPNIDFVTKTFSTNGTVQL
jgi:lipopolysaccharide transport system ATP-binding protein